MLVVVKTPHIELKGEGEIPEPVLKALKAAFGKKVKISDDDEYIDWFKTKEHKEISKRMKPGTYVRIYRENLRLTQAQLAERAGLTRQVISDIENHRRPMTLKRAQAFSKALDVRIERFIRH